MDALDAPEITDLIVACDPDTLERLPVNRGDVVDRFRALGRTRAARLVERLPARAGLLDDGAIDALLVDIHTELQRLHEEFHHGWRILALLRPLIAVLPRPISIVDIGCGTGYAIRWLASRGELGDVELIGCDYNAALIGAARRAAAQEGLACRFEVANAFRLARPASIYLSMGVVHHFRGAALDDFFRAQVHADTQAYLHFDIAPTWLTPIGAWIFHMARMRHPIARHDGIWSALRAHPDEILLSAARGAGGFAVGTYASPSGPLPLTRTVRPIVGVRPEHAAPLRERLGPRAHLLTELA